MFIIAKGRDTGEKYAFSIENGISKGMSFFDLNHQINNKKILSSIYYTNGE